ncbi:hypothetical protein TBLA_0C04470 [Henningerozyma blattae CBS 6284]|uniref:Pre-mRNA-splicing factor SYF2 n=1 Tax=Henningerozyma blattae (strain ATCC 34711 / CBS 6284 / DSM 70876 / NBRC 10599 / NRRL Y-10934 / UCD 77-7) TaxID=1071380 RepID=I2H1J2_HENB6|nr:hypothetical protein TBLA_0C04470 [Tetrapisispora blattae CBS 6284]CCH60244.1 hypothetical protein TBLA_0C04470 [Tetrapisispora blattae CBS 6284]
MYDINELETSWKTLKEKAENTRINNQHFLTSLRDKSATNNKPKVYSMTDEFDKDELPINDENARKNHSEEERISKLMNYTLREYKDWELKQNEYTTESQTNSKDDQIESLDSLAKRTYDKDIRKLNKALRATNSGNKSNKPGKIIKNHRNESNKIVIKDDKFLVEELVNNLKTKSDRLYKHLGERRKNYSTTLSGHVNTKNQEFNEKLTREWKKLSNSIDHI